MKSILTLLCSFFLLFPCLIGCDRVGSEAPPINSRQIAAQTGNPTSSELTSVDTRPVIVAFGDSLTAGYGVNSEESYPADLQSDLDARGYHYRVVNEGVSGNTSKDGVLRIPEILKFHPSIVIVAFGGNDGLRGIPIRDTEMNLQTIISNLQDAHAKVILGGITLPPNYGRQYIAQFNAIYRKEAVTFHIPLLPFMLKGVYGVPGSMQGDGIHPTAKGCRQVAKNFLPLLLPLLHKPPKPRTLAEDHPS